MAFLSNILAVAQPTGTWVSIIKAFEGAVGNYVLAIILLTLVIRIVWSVVETLNKYSTQKMTAIQSQMQPEMEKLQAKYEKQPQILQQKKNELQQRYMGKSQIGGCLITLVVMVLNLVIFFTLFGGINSMASYKISYNYDNLKYTYANCLNIVDEYLGDEISEQEKEKFKNYENLKFVIEGEGETKTISLVEVSGDNETPLASIPYIYDFSTEENNPAYTGEEGSEEPEKITITSNENIYKLIVKYFPVDAEGNYDKSQDIVVKKETIDGEDGQPVEVQTYLSQAIQEVAMQNIVSEYDNTKESFLWIKNIWIADSPFTSSILSYDSLASQMGKANVGEKEKEIYNAFMPNLQERRNETNGYLILPILCVLAGMLSTYITTLYNKIKNKKKGLPPMKRNAKWAQVIVPVLLGIFALFYNSVFSIYMLTTQVVSALVLPLQLLVVDKILEKKEKKKEEEKITVDYSRKF